jgi:hypothetical protein
VEANYSSGGPPQGIKLPIARRTFLMGTTPTVDRTQNPAASYQLSKEIGTLTMFWVTPNGVGLFEKLSKQNPVAKKTNFEAIQGLGLTPILNMNPWTVLPGKGVVRNDGSGRADFSDPKFAAALCEEARQIAKRFRPDYFSIGNEINSVFEVRGEKVFDDFALLEKKIYRAVKEASPATKVLVVLSYSQLVDLPGKPRFFLIDKLADSYDVLGITSYPWKKYAGPEKLPADYYLRLQEHTSKPIGFTEIAWSSDAGQGGSDQEQVDFLVRFLELTRGLKLEFVNWAFLHDLPRSSVTGFIVQKTHLGLGLRNYDGTPKPVWDYYRALYLLRE